MKRIQSGPAALQMEGSDWTASLRAEPARCVSSFKTHGRLSFLVSSDSTSERSSGGRTESAAPCGRPSPSWTSDPPPAALEASRALLPERHALFMSHRCGCPEVAGASWNLQYHHSDMAVALLPWQLFRHRTFHDVPRERREKVSTGL